MAQRLGNERAFLWLIAALVSLPAVLYACLGLSSRLMGDDFGLFATALRLGGRHNFDYWWNGWYSSYTFILFNDLLAPLGPEYLAPAFPSINIALWLLGLTWLFALALGPLQLKRKRMPISVTLAALTLAATFTSFQTWESIFWYAASVRYVLPIGILMIFLASVITVAGAPRSRRLRAAASVLGAVICFVNVGFSELHAALQLCCLSLALLAVLVTIDRTQVRSYMIPLSAGWLGSAAGLLAQLLNPGWSARLEKLLRTDPADPVSSLPQFFADTINTTLDFISYPAGIPSFLLLMAAGMAAGLVFSHRDSASKSSVSRSRTAGPYLFGLGSQLCFLPMLWRDSDALAPFSGQVYGLAINGLLIFLFLFALWRRRQIEASLTAHTNGMTRYISLNLGAALALMALTQLPGFSSRLGLYLFVSALLLLALLSWQLHRIGADARARPFAAVAAASVALALAAWLIPVAVGQLSLGVVFKRTLPFSTLTQLLSALICGGYLGYLIGRCCSPATWIGRFAAMCVLLAASVIIGIVWMQARLIADFQTYAQDWDARHRRIVQLRESGEGEIEVAPLRFDLSEFIAANGRSFDGLSPYFYGVDSIAIAEAAAP